MKFNKQGMAMMVVIGLIGIGVVLMVTIGTVLDSYIKTSNVSRQYDKSVHYAEMALDEIKWNIMKEYKKWLYDATHTMGTNGPDYDPKINPAYYDDIPKTTTSFTAADLAEYNYATVATVGFSDSDYKNTYWVKVVDSIIQEGGLVYEPSSSSSSVRIIGRVEGWIRIAEKSANTTDFAFRYDVFCKGTDYYSGTVTLNSKQKPVLSADGKQRTAFIRASAQSPDSISISEFSVAVFDSFLNVGNGYNVYGKMHANDYISFIDDASNDFNQVAKFYNVVSTSGYFTFKGSTNPKVGDPLKLQTVINANANTSATIGTQSVKTNGFHFSNSGKDYAWAMFLADVSRPAIVAKLTPKTEDHFASVRVVAQQKGVLVEGGDAAFIRFEPGDLSKNGDGYMKIKTTGGKLWVNGKIVSSTATEKNIYFSSENAGANLYMGTAIIYVDGNPATPVYNSSSNPCKNATLGSISNGMYITKGIRGLCGVVDGQVSIYSGYDITFVGDVIYQEYAVALKYLYRDMGNSGTLVQPYISSSVTPADPDPNKPNLVGINAKHDVILPGDLWATTSYFTKGSTRYYTDIRAARCDSKGTGVTTGTLPANSEWFADLFTFGVIFAGNRVYGEVANANTDTYARTWATSGGYPTSSAYLREKGTWVLYGSLSDSLQVYATSGSVGFQFRSYNYDPNLYTFKPPMTMSITSLPIWSWRLTGAYPTGISVK